MLDEATVDEMWSPQVMLNPDDWTVGWGLGLELVNHEGRDLRRPRRGDAGVPGGPLRQPRDEDRRRRADERRHARADASTSRSSSRDATLELWPPDIEPWRPEPPPPPEIAAAPRPLVVRGQRVRVLVEGRPRSTARAARSAAAGQAVGRSSRVEGGYRVVSGRERGERLRVEGDRLIWGGLRLHARARRRRRRRS